jgi:hypothetical protein
MGIYQGKASFPTGHFDTSINFFRVARNYVAILLFERLKHFFAYQLLIDVRQTKDIGTMLGIRFMSSG